jgi:hypothetical protein
MSRYHIFISSGMVNLQCTVLMQLTVGIYGATIMLLDGTNVHMVCVYTYIHIYIYTRIYIHVYTHTHIYIYIYIYIYCSAIVHLGTFCIENAPTLVATRSCPVATGAHSGCNLFTSGCN